MLIVKKKTEESTLTLVLEGRLDTGSAPQLEAELKSSITGIAHLVFDLKGLEYTSSAGLRILLFAQKTMNQQGDMVIRNANEEIMEVFEITGIVDIVRIE